MFSNGFAKGTPFSISVLRIVSAANLTADLAQPLREFANSCLKSIQPIAPELLALRINYVDLSTWETNLSIYSMGQKPLEWKKDFCTFHLALRLLQSNKLADIKDFVSSETPAINSKLWEDATSAIRKRDSDYSGDLDTKEFGKLGDFASVDMDHDGRLTDVEYYRYLLEEKKQHDLDQAKKEISFLAKGVESYKLKTGAFPKTLEALWNDRNVFPKDMLLRPAIAPGPDLDPWGTAYHFNTDGTSFLIRSNGPDRIADTDDDLTSND